MTAGRWEECISYRGLKAQRFVEEYFSQRGRKTLLIASAGFDHRAGYIAEVLHEVASEPVAALFIRERRPEPTEENVRRADATESKLRALYPEAHILQIEVFSERDSAVVAGSQIVRRIRELDLDAFTDVVLDVSALSVGLGFPLVRYFVDEGTRRRRSGRVLNVHALLIADGEVDEQIEREFMDKVATVQGFAGQLGLTARRDRIARLWVPQLSSRKQVAMRLIHQHLSERAPLLDVCPLIPYPSRDPRLGDRLAIEYLEELEGPWLVDERNLLVVAEDDPLDVYRVLLRLDEARREVFAAIGDSEIVLSPIGPKAMAFGCLLAAIERDFPVVYVETLRYGLGATPSSVSADQVLYFWLCGEAYEV